MCLWPLLPGSHYPLSRMAVDTHRPIRHLPSSASSFNVCVCTRGGGGVSTAHVGEWLSIINGRKSLKTPMLGLLWSTVWKRLPPVVVLDVVVSLSFILTSDPSSWQPAGFFPPQLSEYRCGAFDKSDLQCLLDWNQTTIYDGRREDDSLWHQGFWNLVLTKKKKKSAFNVCTQDDRSRTDLWLPG